MMTRLVHFIALTLSISVYANEPLTFVKDSPIPADWIQFSPNTARHLRFLPKGEGEVLLLGKVAAESLLVLDGQPIPLEEGRFRIPLVLSDNPKNHTIGITLPSSEKHFFHFSYEWVREPPRLNLKVKEGDTVVEKSLKTGKAGDSEKWVRFFWLEEKHELGWHFSAGTGASFLTYNQTSVNPITITAAHMTLSFERDLSTRWSALVHGLFHLVPFQITGTNDMTRFLNLGLGVNYHRRSNRWGLLLSGNLEYLTLVTAARNFGFANLGGFELGTKIQFFSGKSNEIFAVGRLMLLNAVPMLSNLRWTAGLGYLRSWGRWRVGGALEYQKLSLQLGADSVALGMFNIALLVIPPG